MGFADIGLESIDYGHQPKWQLGLHKNGTTMQTKWGLAKMGLDKMVVNRPRPIDTMATVYKMGLPFSQLQWD